MLPAGAPKRHHQVLEAAFLVIIYAGINKGNDITKILVDTFVLRQVIGYLFVFAREISIALFAPGIRQAAQIENESAAIPGIIVRKPLMERKTKDMHGQLLLLGFFEGDALQFL